MFVDTDLLHAGADQSHRAGGHAQEGVDRLSRAPLASGMFGAFPAAATFHAAVTAAREQHVNNLQAHQETLTGLGHNAHYAANAFTNVDDRNAAQERAVRWTSATSAVGT
ncbi:DUF2563 family protein [Mycobacterium sp. E787]|uniref:DUF2563 family protein n=1 Tax=Mycobacterium sp. E787 TaxID=1834150 RepID=UPI0007FC3A5E|nr:DUF2563 family protein [Mycobacterium sp. E787]OBI51757.1 hypothetical protein A5705_00410 [Mycobacterium sp. E787]